MAFDVTFNELSDPVDPVDPVDPPISGNPTAFLVQGDESGGQNITINQYPTNPMAGEPVVYWCTSQSGWGPLADPEKQIIIAANFGDEGSTYRGGPDGNANLAVGWVVGHTFETPGSYVQTFIARLANGKSRTITLTTVVSDPDAHSWGRQVCWDPSGAFTNFPAAGGSVVYCTTRSQVLAQVPGNNTDVRYLMARGQQFDWLDTAIQVRQNCITRVEARGSGARPLVYFNNPGQTNRSDNRTFLRKGNSTGTRLTVVGIAADGGCDPTTMTLPRGLNNFITEAGATGTQTGGTGIHDCDITGMDSGYMVSGTDRHSGIVYLRVSNTRITNWHNYGIGWFGGTKITARFGNIIAQHPFAAKIGDAKIVGGLDAPDHGPGRQHNVLYSAEHNSSVNSANGWSPNGPSNINYGHGAQTCSRNHGRSIGPNIPRALFSITRNVMSGDGGMISSGTHSFGTTEAKDLPDHPMIMVIAFNKFYGGGQASTLFGNNGVGGMKIISNVMIVLNLLEYGGGSNRRNGIIELSGNPGIATSAREQPIAFEQNTYVNLRDTADHGSNVFDFERERGQTKTVEQWNGPAVNYAGNVMHFPGLPNGGAEGSFTLSPGDDFNLVAGSPSGINAVAGDCPYDINGNLRRGQTNAGAHDTEVASVSAAPAPTMSSVTISEVTTTTSRIPEDDFFSVTDADYVGMDYAFLAQVRWRRAASEIAAELGGFPVLPTDEKNGQAITAEVTLATPGGTVSRVSNAL